MENSIIDLKNDLIEWIENTFDTEILQKVVDLKNNFESSSLISDINTEIPVENNFDQQFAAGMTSDELMENIATHLESISSEEPSSVGSDIQSQSAIKNDFNERFAEGIPSQEMRSRTIEYIRSLPGKQ